MLISQARIRFDRCSGGLAGDGLGHGQRAWQGLGIGLRGRTGRWFRRGDGRGIGKRLRSGVDSGYG